MERLQPYLAKLEERHRAALLWFAARADTVTTWPGEIDTGAGKTFLATKAKGIYKPAWSKYALSVRQSLGGPYPDLDPIVQSDGTWSYAYFQENRQLTARDLEFTNRGLLACWKDKVPVGVFRQIQERPYQQYRVLGLALITGWTEGYFFLEGFSRSGLVRGPGPLAELDWLSRRQTRLAGEEGAFDPHTVFDARERVMAEIVRRRGQPKFRSELLAAYGYRCAISNCDAEPALEACHIFPYRGPHTNHVSNGLLLRGDLHTLFDLGLIAVSPKEMRVLTSPKVEGTCYEQLKGVVLRAPVAQHVRPDQEALRAHLDWTGI